MSTTWTNPPQYARELGVSVCKVLRWIDTGELKAVNMAVDRKGRPRWKIRREDIADFERKRANTPATDEKPKRRRAKVAAGCDVIEFF